MKIQHIFTLLFCGLFAQAQTNISLISHTPIPQYGGASGVIGATQQASDILAFTYNNTKYAAIGAFKGTVIFNINNPAAPVEVAYVPNADGSTNTWRDLETWGDYLYVGQESNLPHAIIDLRTLGGTVSTTWWSPAFIENGNPVNFASSHTIWIDNGFLYMNRSGGTYIFDVRTSPTAPVFMGHAQPAGNYTHDCYTRNDTLYVSDIYGGACVLYDVHDKTNPTPVGLPITTPFLFNHNSWVSNNGTYLFVTDERPDAPVTAYNIHDRNNMFEMSQFKRFPYTTGTVAHNVYCVPNDFMVVAHYTDGVVLLDTKYPDNMIEVGNYDTYPAAVNTQHPYQGIWAVNCTDPNRLVASDINTGLFIFQPTYNRASWLQGTTTDITNGSLLTNVQVQIKRTNTAIAETYSKTTGVYKTGHAQAGACQVVCTKAGYYDEIVNTTLVQGQITALNVQMRPLVGTDNAVLLGATITAQPNPFSESANIFYDFGTIKTEGAALKVYNSTGVLVETHTLGNTTGNISLGANLAAGVYMVVLSQNNLNSAPQRIVKM
jgi:choice-of-anchor B domain-containing protein